MKNRGNIFIMKKPGRIKVNNTGDLKVIDSLAIYKDDFNLANLFLNINTCFAHFELES